MQDQDQIRYMSRRVSGIAQDIALLTDPERVEKILLSLPHRMTVAVRQKMHKERGQSFTAFMYETATKRAFFVIVASDAIQTWTWWHGVPDKQTADRLLAAIGEMEASGEMLFGVSRAERVLERATGKRRKKQKLPRGVVEI